MTFPSIFQSGIFQPGIFQVYPAEIPSAQGTTGGFLGLNSYEEALIKYAEKHKKSFSQEITDKILEEIINSLKLVNFYESPISISPVLTPNSEESIFLKIEKEDFAAPVFSGSNEEFQVSTVVMEFPLAILEIDLKKNLVRSILEEYSEEELIILLAYELLQ